MFIQGSSGNVKPAGPAKTAGAGVSAAAESTPRIAGDGLVRSSDATARDGAARDQAVERCLNQLDPKTREERRALEQMVGERLDEVKRLPGESDASFTNRLGKAEAAALAKGKQMEPMLEWNRTQAAYLAGQVAARLALAAKYEAYAVELGQRQFQERQQQARVEVDADYEQRATITAQKLKKANRP